MPPPFLRLLSDVYGSIALARRRWTCPIRPRDVGSDRPVISIGNLSVGGTGKTPLVAAIARLLVDMGERPAILSRGYKRRYGSDDVVIVSDGHSVLADVEHAGDEPFMLARAVPRAAVLVSTARYLAGRVAETRLGCTVHLLDDGFQHFPTGAQSRSVDRDERRPCRSVPLPRGRLREPFSVAAAADAVFVSSGDVAGDVDGRPVFQMDQRSTRRERSRLTFSQASASRHRLPSPARCLRWRALPTLRDSSTTCGRPGGISWERGCLPIHYQFSTLDITEVLRAAESAGAKAVLTTEKDVVRLSEDPHPDPHPQPPTPNPYPMDSPPCHARPGVRPVAA